MSPIKTDKILNGQLMSSTYVFLTEGDLLKSRGDVSFVKLRHPSSSRPATFIIGPGKGSVREVLSFNEPKRSWFVDENVKSDGKLLISTPMDPIFLIIPYLKKLSKVTPLEQCLEDSSFPEIRRLADCPNLRLSLVADRKGDESFRAYKFNEEKTLDWLREKTNRLVGVIKGKNINVSQATVSANYVNSQYKSESEMEYLQYAHGIISEYLDEDLTAKLAKHLNLPEASETKKRKQSNASEGGTEKKSKTETNDANATPKKSQTEPSPRSVKSENAKPTTASKKDQARQKAAKGSKSIMSFFKKV